MGQSKIEIEKQIMSVIEESELSQYSSGINLQNWTDKDSAQAVSLIPSQKLKLFLAAKWRVRADQGGYTSTSQIDDSYYEFSSRN
jgi:hypothetical protein